MMGYLFLGIRTSVGCTESSSSSGFQLQRQPHPDEGATKRQQSAAADEVEGGIRQRMF
jgi:hypothetical protein